MTLDRLLPGERVRLGYGAMTAASCGPTRWPSSTVRQRSALLKTAASATALTQAGAAELELAVSRR